MTVLLRATGAPNGWPTYSLVRANINDYNSPVIVITTNDRIKKHLQRHEPSGQKGWLCRGGDTLAAFLKTNRRGKTLQIEYSTTDAPSMLF